MSERICPNCGEAVSDANFCLECGEPLAPAADSDEDASEAPAGGVPPLPSEEAAAASEGIGSAEGGAEQSGTDLPASEPPAAPAGEGEGESAEEPAGESEEEGVVPDEVQARGPHQEPVVAGATPMQQAAEDARAPAAPVDGQLRCPDCEEAVYGGERVCWSCSRRLEVGEPQAEAGSPAEARQAPEGGPPASGGPVARQVPQTASAPDARSGYSELAEQPQQRARPEASDEAMSYAWWSFGLGLLSVFTCGILGLLGIASLWLGVSAARRDAGPVAIAGIVFGAIGLLMLLAWIVALAIAMPQMMQSGPTHIILPVFM